MEGSLQLYRLEDEMSFQKKAFFLLWKVKIMISYSMILPVVKRLEIEDDLF